MKSRGTQGLVWGSLLIIFGLLMVLEQFTDLAAWVWVLGLIAAGLVLVGIYLSDRSQRWTLIPAYVLLAVGIMVGLITAGVLDDLLIPAYVMFAIAIPFFSVYVRNRKEWWPLIPGGIMAAIGLSFLLAEGGFQFVVALVVIGVGVWILVRGFGPQARAVSDAGVAPAPEVDEPGAE
jgi:hypothetical protein